MHWHWGPGVSPTLLWHVTTLLYCTHGFMKTHGQTLFLPSLTHLHKAHGTKAYHQIFMGEIHGWMPQLSRLFIYIKFLLWFRFQNTYMWCWCIKSGCVGVAVSYSWVLLTLLAKRGLWSTSVVWYHSGVITKIVTFVLVRVLEEFFYGLFFVFIIVRI